MTITITPATGPATLPINVIQASATNPRKRFPKAKQAELEASVLKHGVLQPLLVRPMPGRTKMHELVAGERRFRAAMAANLKEVPVLVRDLTDDEVLHIQIIENLQREDLHPLEEADGYKVLAARGHTFEQIAEEVSQTRAYVAQRMKLCSLIESARTLFFDGKLSASTALIVARLPVDLQEKAAKTIAQPDWTGESMGPKQASEYVQRDFMLRLDQAPFKTADIELVPAAGACGPCPKRTGNQVDLFGDVKSADLCTDPPCFAKKREAAADQKRAAALAAGRQVIAGKEAKKIKPHDYSSQLTGGWVKLDERCYDDEKSRPFRQIIGKASASAAAVLEDPHTGVLIDVMQHSDLKKLLADKGIQAKRGSTSSNPDAAKQQAKKKADDAYRSELFAQVRSKHEGYGLDDFDMKIVAVTFYRRLWHENQKRLMKLYGWGPKVLKEAEFAVKVDEMATGTLHGAPEALGRLVIDIALIDETVSASYSTGKPDLMEALARERGLDPVAIRKQVDGALKEKAKPAPAAKKVAKKVAVKVAAKKVTTRAPAKKAAAEKTPPAAVKTPAIPSGQASFDRAHPKLKKGNGADPAGAWPFPTGHRPS